MRFIICFSIAILFSFQSFGQSGSYLALNQFLNTDFFHQYDEVRVRAENSVRNFKMIQGRYTEEEIQAVIDAYNSSAEYFNLALLNIKNDLMIKEKRKYIINYPESYSKQIETDLNRAKEYYANTYQREVTELTNGEITGAALLAMLPQLIKYAKFAIDAIKKIRGEVQKMNEALLQKHLVEPYQFKSWDEVN